MAALSGSYRATVTCWDAGRVKPLEIPCEMCRCHLAGQHVCWARGIL